MCPMKMIKMNQQARSNYRYSQSLLKQWSKNHEQDFNGFDMKRFLYYCLIPLAGAILLLTQINTKEESTKQHYGTLTLSSEIEGLPIYIDEKLVGETRKEIQTFDLPAVGVYGEADHEVVVQKEIDSTHEYYFRTEFSFNRYIDVQETPIKQIALFISPPQNDSYPPSTSASAKDSNRICSPGERDLSGK